MKLFKTFTVIAVGILLMGVLIELKAQNYLYMPESICYNTLTKKYYVSSFMNGRIVEIDTNGNQTIILIGQTQCAGNAISNNILYFSSQKNVKAYNIAISPPEEVMNIYIPEATFLDGMTLDNSGNLYVCDNGYPNSVDKIYKINLSTHGYWVFVPGSHGLTVSLQDVVFDEQNNRLISASANYSNSIQSISLSDSTVTNISSQVKLIDGIARDSEGNYYFTSWYTYALHRFNSSFTGNAVVIASNLNGPSQPCYNPDRNLIAVPLFNANQIAYVQLPPSAASGQATYLKDFELMQNYPNPFNPLTRIRFNIPWAPLSSGEGLEVRLIIYDLLGREVDILMNKTVKAGSYEVVWDGTNYPSGVYFYSLITVKNVITKKMELIK